MKQEKPLKHNGNTKSGGMEKVVLPTKKKDTGKHNRRNNTDVDRRERILPEGNQKEKKKTQMHNIDKRNSKDVGRKERILPKGNHKGNKSKYNCNDVKFKFTYCPICMHYGSIELQCQEIKSEKYIKTKKSLENISKKKKKNKTKNRMQKQHSLFDKECKDALRYAKKKLNKGSCLDEQFHWLYSNYPRVIEKSIEKEQQDKKMKRSVLCSSVARASPMETVSVTTALLLLPTVLAQQYKETSTENFKIVVTIVTMMAVLLLICLCIFLKCYCCRRTEINLSLNVENGLEAEKRPFLNSQESCETDTIKSIRRYLFNPMNTKLKRQKGGGGDEQNVYEVYRKQKIGSGGIANVYMAKYQGNFVAAKVFQGLDKRSRDVMKKEFRILQKLTNENIVQLLHFDEENETLLLELCFVENEGTRIYDLKQWADTCHIKTSLCYANIIKQMTSGVQYLHQNHILHSDLKPQNILCKDDFNMPTLKITDFGSAYREAITHLEVSKISSQHGNFGTDLYKAPETFDRRNKSGKTTENDMYALAFTISDTINPSSTGKTLYGDELEEINQYTIMEVKKDRIVPVLRTPKDCNTIHFQDMLEALTTCLDGVPQKRLTIKKLHAIACDLHQHMQALDDSGSMCEKTVVFSQKQVPLRTGQHLEETIAYNDSTPGASNFLSFEDEHFICVCTSLGISQATASFLVGGYTHGLDYEIPEVRQLQLLLQGQNQQENLKLFESTNACAFYSVLILDAILIDTNFNLEAAQRKAREIILLSQLEFNSMRDSEKTYHPEDAIRILNKKLLLNIRDYEDLQYGKQIQPDSYEDMLEQLSRYFMKVHQCVQMKHAFFYTVGELTFSFTIRYQEEIGILIDSHTLPEIENAVICIVNLKEAGSYDADIKLCTSMAKLLAKRVYASKGEQMFSLYHQIDLVTRDMSEEEQHQNKTEQYTSEHQDITSPSHSISPTHSERLKSPYKFSTPTPIRRKPSLKTPPFWQRSPSLKSTKDSSVPDSAQMIDMSDFSVHEGNTSTPSKTALLPYQLEAFNQVKAGRDTILIWPTGRIIIYIS